MLCINTRLYRCHRAYRRKWAYWRYRRKRAYRTYRLNRRYWSYRCNWRYRTGRCSPQRCFCLICYFCDSIYRRDTNTTGNIYS